jgi:membrane-associated protease RseP (regulator of RpoE activity)
MVAIALPGTSIAGKRLPPAVVKVAKLPVTIGPSAWVGVPLAASIATLAHQPRLAAGLGLAVGSTLVHEGAHMAAARALGIRPTGVSVTIGGATTHFPDAEWAALRPWRRAAIAVAGPAANFALSLAATAAKSHVDPSLWPALDVTSQINFLLGTLNLFPFGGLDGSLLVASIREAWHHRARPKSAPAAPLSTRRT